MVHPNVEVKWQLDKIRTLVNSIDTELDEADYRINQSEELREQEDKREVDRKELATLVQKSLEHLDGIDILNARDAKDRSIIENKLNLIYNLLEKVLGELNK